MEADILPEEALSQGEVAMEKPVKEKRSLLGLRRKAEGGKVECAFGDTFFVESKKVDDPKIIKEVIRGVALDLFPDNDSCRSNDFYYSYLYEDGTLTYAILKSTSYLTGKFPGFLPAMLNPGRYIYQWGSQYYVIENIGGMVTSTLHNEPQQDGEDLRELAAKGVFTDVPSTLCLQWSLTHHHRPITVIMAGVFIALLAGYGLSMQGYNQLSKRVATLNTSTPQAEKVMIPRIDARIRTVAEALQPYGAMIKFVKKMDKSNLAFSVQFKNENDAREFILHKGGTYEDGKVVFAMPIQSP